MESTGDEASWHKKGDPRLGARVRRAVLSDDNSETVAGFADGTVTGWLPSRLSDYISEFTNKPASLWHIEFDSKSLGGEDLEEVELDDAIAAWENKAFEKPLETEDFRNDLLKKLSLEKSKASVLGAEASHQDARKNFNEAQRELLEAHFRAEKYVSKETAEQLAFKVNQLKYPDTCGRIGMVQSVQVPPAARGRTADANTVTVWFMNRRKRDRKSVSCVSGTNPLTSKVLSTSTSSQDVSALPIRSAAEGLLSLKKGSALGNGIGKEVQSGNRLVYGLHDGKGNGGRTKMRARYLTALERMHMRSCGVADDGVQAQEQGEGMMGVEIVKVAMSQDIEDMSHGHEQQPPPPPSEEDVNTNFDLVPHGIHTCWECRKGKYKSWKCSAKRCRSQASSGVKGALGHTGPNWFVDIRETIKQNADGSPGNSSAGKHHNNIGKVGKSRHMGNDTTFEVGEEVESAFRDGNWYTAVIDDVRADGTVLLTWHDNDSRDRIKPQTEIRKIRVFPADLEELDDSERTSRRQQATRWDEQHGGEEEKDEATKIEKGDGLKKGDGASGGKAGKGENIDAHMSEEVDADVSEDGQTGDKNDIGDIYSSGRLRAVAGGREQKKKYSVSKAKFAGGERTACDDCRKKRIRCVHMAAADMALGVSNKDTKKHARENTAGCGGSTIERPIRQQVSSSGGNGSADVRKSALKTAQEALVLYRGQCLEGMRTPELLMLKEVHEEALMHVSKELLMRECETEVASEHPEYVCPLSANAQGNCDVKGGGKGNVLMEDAVVAADGWTYDRKNIERWIRESQQKGQAICSPKTGALLSHTFLVPNEMLKAGIEAALDEMRKRKPSLQVGSGGAVATLRRVGVGRAVSGIVSARVKEGGREGIGDTDGSKEARGKDSALETSTMTPHTRKRDRVSSPEKESKQVSRVHGSESGEQVPVLSCFDVTNENFTCPNCQRGFKNVPKPQRNATVAKHLKHCHEKSTL